MWKHTPYAIFDMDGTLIDSMPYWDSLASDYLIRQGIQPPGNLNEILNPMTMSQSAAYLKEQYDLPGTPQQIKAELHRLMNDNYRSRIPAKEGVPEYLQQLRQQGVCLSVCSSTPKPLIEAALTRLGLLSFFRAVVSCDEVGEGKHSPAAYLLAMKRMGSDTPADCTVYEDAFFAMNTAHNCGMKVIGVFDKACTADRQDILAICDHYLESFISTCESEDSTHNSLQ